VLAPASILAPGQTYSVAVTPEARDVDGNPLGGGSLLSFSTGPLRPLKHWVSFSAAAPEEAAGEGVWIVDENRFPRRIVAAPVDRFTWSAAGARLLLRSPAGAWTEQPVGEAPVAVPLRGEWPGYLAPDRGFAYLDEGSLKILDAGGRVVEIATGVAGAALAPGGTRIAYTVPGRSGSEIRAYDVDLRSHYNLQQEGAAVSGLDWAPDGSAIAYRLEAGDPEHRQLRVRSLGAEGATSTVATGEVGLPRWQADSRHLIFTAVIATAAGRAQKAFRLSAGAAVRSPLSPGLALPAAADLEVAAPAPSPDGHQIAFLAQQGGRAQIYVMNADGTGVAALTAYDPAGFPYSCRAPAWTRS